ncbi:MAG TPA: hypothetical protein VKR32_12530 [Puia sp.]|nr:hypothetical protein [Puia sp.]
MTAGEAVLDDSAEIFVLPQTKAGDQGKEDRLFSGGCLEYTYFVPQIVGMAFRDHKVIDGEFHLPKLIIERRGK